MVGQGVSLRSGMPLKGNHNPYGQAKDPRAKSPDNPGRLEPEDSARSDKDVRSKLDSKTQMKPSSSHNVPELDYASDYVTSTFNQPEGDGNECVKVCVRVRPLVPKEKLESCQPCVDVRQNGKDIVIGKNRAFTFDYSFGISTSQETIYSTCVSSLVQSCFEGYNATVLAYGQTGSGKTFTMGTSPSSSTLDHDLGIIPRVVANIFEKISDLKETDVLVKVDYLEIYNEMIRDLFCPDNKGIMIRETPQGIHVLGIQSKIVRSASDIFHLLAEGSANRSVGSTLMNEQSSRSHALFTINIEQRDRRTEEYTKAKFHLVDLAGSERNKRTGAVGGRFKESVSINQGLLSLGNVISALGDPKKKAKHVPYRESKLTRLLQDSLGGNSRTLMIACISPADVNFDETLNTLKYANRARNIRNKPIVNHGGNNAEEVSAEIAKMQEEISSLQHKLQKANSEESEDSAEAIQQLQSQVAQLTDRNQTLEAELSAARAGLQDTQSLVKRIAMDLVELDRSNSATEGIRQQLIPILKLLKVGYDQVLRPLTAVGGRPCPPSVARPRTASSLGKKVGMDFLSSLPLPPPSVKKVGTPGLAVEQSQDALAELERKLQMKEQECRDLQDKLTEALEDLDRDERIFASKMSELAEYLKELEGLRLENAKLKGEITILKPLPRQEEGADTVLVETYDPDNEDFPDPQPAKNLGHLEELIAVSNQKLELEEEKRRVEEGKRKLEEEKLRLQLETEAARREHEDKIRMMENAMQELEVNIRLKEELIERVNKTESSASDLVAQYRERVEQLEQEIQAAKDKVQEAAAELEELERAKTERDLALEQRAAQRREYEGKLRAATEELESLRRQQKETEKLIKLKQQSDKRIQDLEQELSKLKEEHEVIKKKRDEEQKNERSKNDSKQRELSSLQKDMEALRKKLRELEEENDRHKQMLKRKTEDVIKAQRKLRVGPTTKERPQTAAAKAKGGKDTKMGPKVPATARAYTGLDEESKTGTESEEKKEERRGGKAELKGEEVHALVLSFKSRLENCFQAYEAELQLARVQSQRQTSETARKTADLRRSALTMKKLRTSHAVSDSIASLSIQLDQLDNQLEDKSMELNSVTNKQDNTPEVIKLELEIDQLLEKKTLAFQRRAELEDAALRQEYLTEEEEKELAALEDEVETLQAEIDFKDAEIDRARVLISESQKELGGEEDEKRAEGEKKEKGAVNAGRHIDVLIKETPNISVLSLAAILKFCCNELMESRLLQREREKAIAVIDLQLHESQKRIHELECIARKLKIDSDRKATQLQTAAEKKIHSLLKQITKLRNSMANQPQTGSAQSSSQAELIAIIEDLKHIIDQQKEQLTLAEKNHEYYKTTNRSLRLQVDQLREEQDAERGRKRAEEELHVAKCKELQVVNDSLMRELTTLKSVIRGQFQGPHSIVVPREAVLEINPPPSASRPPSSSSSSLFAVKRPQSRQGTALPAFEVVETRSVPPPPPSVPPSRSGEGREEKKEGESRKAEAVSSARFAVRTPDLRPHAPSLPLQSARRREEQSQEKRGEQPELDSIDKPRPKAGGERAKPLFQVNYAPEREREQLQEREGNEERERGNAPLVPPLSLLQAAVGKAPALLTGRFKVEGGGEAGQTSSRTGAEEKREVLSQEKAPKKTVRFAVQATVFSEEARTESRTEIEPERADSHLKGPANGPVSQGERGRIAGVQSARDREAGAPAITATASTARESSKGREGRELQQGERKGDKETQRFNVIAAANLPRTGRR